MTIFLISLCVFNTIIGLISFIILIRQPKTKINRLKETLLMKLFEAKRCKKQ